MYMWLSTGFCEVETDAPSRKHGGVALFYKDPRHFIVEALQLHGPNVVRFHMVIGGRGWHFVGFYLAPHNASNLERVVTTTGKIPQGREIFVAGDFTVDLAA